MVYVERSITISLGFRTQYGQYQIGLLLNWIITLEKVRIRGSGDGKESVVRGCRSGVIWEKREGSREEYGSGLWGGFAMIALLASQWINSRRTLLRRFSVLAEMSS